MERFGSYTLFERVGSGGMCEVVRARRVDAQDDVALKRLHPELEHNPRAVDLFLTEADLAVLLQHPNLVRALESGEVDGRYFIAFELLRGLPLQRAMELAAERCTPIDEPLAVHIGIEIARGLAYLHTARSPAGRAFELVHRDVSPDNVFLTERGEVKLADLGIAKLGALEGVTTILDGVKGRLSFMSPEQLRGERLDHRTDQFAAALILYELLTGRRPYARREGEPDAALALRVRDADIPRARRLEPSLPRTLDRALHRALRRRVDRRFPSCLHLVDALDHYCERYTCARGSNDVAALVRELSSSSAL